MLAVENDIISFHHQVRQETLPKCRVLLVEDDYVSFKLIENSLNGCGAIIDRSNSLEEALSNSYANKMYDLLIVNISLTCVAHFSAIGYLKGVFSVPVLAIDNGENDLRHEEIGDWADCIFNLYNETDLFTETISDMLSD